MVINLWTRILATLKNLPFAGWTGAVNTGFAGRGGTMGYAGARVLPATDMDVVREAGPLHLNAVVAAVIAWKAAAWMSAPISLVRVNGDDEDPVASHAFLGLMERPHPALSGRTLWRSVLQDWHAAGNAYLYKERAPSGNVVGLRWLPAHCVAPASRSAMEYITHYEYWAQGQKTELAAADVIHFRNGLDPENTRLGLSDLVPVLREIATINEAATYRLSAVKSPVPGLVLWPEGDAVLDDDEDRAALADELHRRFSGARRFRAMVMSAKMGLSSAGYSPEQMALDTLVRYPEQYICAALAVPPMVLGYASGRDEATYANYGEAVRSAWSNGIIPAQDLFAEELRIQLLRAEPKTFGYADDLAVRFDRSRVEALQESVNDRAERNVRAAGGAYISVNEARAEAGLEPVEGHDEIRDNVPLPYDDPRSESQKLRERGYRDDTIQRILDERRRLDVVMETER